MEDLKKMCIEQKEFLGFSDVEKIVIDVIKNNGDLWWRYEHESSMAEVHRIKIEINNGAFPFKFSTTCNCRSQSSTEAYEEDSWEISDLNWNDLIAQLKGWLVEHDHYKHFFSAQDEKLEEGLENKSLDDLQVSFLCDGIDTQISLVKKHIDVLKGPNDVTNDECEAMKTLVEKVRDLFILDEEPRWSILLDKINRLPKKVIKENGKEGD